MKSKVYIATSIDGYISDSNNNLDWLHSIPNPEGIDMGYNDFMANADAIIMGRNTFEAVCSFNVPWPYSKPVFVLSNSLNSVTPEYEDKVSIINGTPSDVIKKLDKLGYKSIYIDGGKTIQGFLQQNLIDELIITVIPVILGGGFPLFGKLRNPIDFKCIDSKIFLDSIVQNHFIRR